jgi:hypothetical protein
MKLTVELSYDCILNCIHCSSRAFRNTALNITDIEKVLNEFPIDEVILSGGEPLGYPGIENLINSLISKNIKVSMNTCGIANRRDYMFFFKNEFEFSSLINGKIAIPYDVLIKLDKIYVSLYGDEYLHNRITRSDSFVSTLTFLATMNRLMTWQYGKDQKRVIVNTPIFDKTQIKSLIDLLGYYDCSLKQNKHILYFPIHLIRLLPHGRAKNIEVLSREEQLKIALCYKDKFPNLFISESLLHNKCNWENKLTLLPNRDLIHCVAGKLSKNPDQEFICDKI